VQRDAARQATLNSRLASPDRRLDDRLAESIVRLLIGALQGSQREPGRMCVVRGGDVSQASRWIARRNHPRYEAAPGRPL